MASLTTGGNAPLNGTSVDIFLEWSEWESRPQDIDLCGFLLGSAGKVRNDIDFVFYNQQVHPSDALRHLGREGTTEKMHLDVALLPSDVHTLAFVGATSTGTFGDAKGLTLSVADSSGVNEELRFELTGVSADTAVVIAELQRAGDEWALTTVERGRAGGLGGAATHFGVHVGTPEEADTTAPVETAAPKGAEPAPEVPPTEEPVSVAPPAPASESPVPVDVPVVTESSELVRPRLPFAKVGPATPNLGGQPLALAVGQSIALLKSGLAPQTLWLRITHTAESGPGADVAVIPYNEYGDPGAAVSFEMDYGAGGKVRLVSKPTNFNPENTAAIELSLFSTGHDTAGLVVAASSYAGTRLDSLRSFVIDLVAPDGALFARSEIPAPGSTGVISAVIKRDAAGNWVFTPIGTEAPGRTVKSLTGAGRWALS